MSLITDLLSDERSFGRIYRSTRHAATPPASARKEFIVPGFPQIRFTLHMLYRLYLSQLLSHMFLTHLCRTICRCHCTGFDLSVLCGDGCLIKGFHMPGSSFRGVWCPGYRAKIDASMWYGLVLRIVEGVRLIALLVVRDRFAFG